jgi:tetratricopeptide (TPR) repeat protein
MLAGCHVDLGNVLMESGEAAEAEREHRAGLAISEQLYREQPNDLEFGCDVARIHRCLGDTLWRQGKQQEGVETIRKAIGQYDALVTKHPGAVEPQLGLAGTFATLAGQFNGIGAPPSARREPADRVIRILEPFLASLPTHPDAQRDLSIAYSIRATSFRLEGKFSEAIPDWDRAVQYSPPYYRATNLASRASSLVRAGRVAEAIADVDAAEKRPDADGSALFNCACVVALASAKEGGKKEEWAKRSIALLRRAVMLEGKHKDAAAKDSDFDSVRGREDFKKLMSENDAAKPTKPTVGRP